MNDFLNDINKYFDKNGNFFKFRNVEVYREIDNCCIEDEKIYEPIFYNYKFYIENKNGEKNVYKYSFNFLDNYDDDMENVLINVFFEEIKPYIQKEEMEDIFKDVGKAKKVKI